MKKLTFAIVTIAIISIASCKNAENNGSTNVTDSTAFLLKDKEISTTEKKQTNWDKVDFTTPIVKYKEITSHNIDVRGNENYSIYGLGEEVLFSTGRADILPDAKSCLSEICGSISQHYPKAAIRVYGYTDSVGNVADNKALSSQRATAVKNYLVSSCNLDSENIDIIAEGENMPIASNDNAQGRQQNRRVRIVAMNK